MAESVRIENLVKTFGAVRAVDNVTLNIEPGEIFFLLGPSGCGKTTLLRCLAGFYDPEQGAIFIGDRDVTRMPPHQRDTGMVFQSYALWPHMSVRENVAFGLEMRKISKKKIADRVAEALALVQMSDRGDSKPNELSGGQQQRVALARALVVHPRCLLLDEPLSNLDARLRLEMRQEIRRICKEVGRTAVYVTHDQKEALSIADRIGVLNEGRIRQVGTPAQIYRRPVDRFVASFIGETNFFEGTVIDVGERGTRVKTGAGELLAGPGAATGFSAGDKVTVSLRPEVLNLGLPRPGLPNTMQCTVEQTVYLGEVAQHLVCLRGVGNDVSGIKVFDLNPREGPRADTGLTPVWVDPADVVLLKE